MNDTSSNTNREQVVTVQNGWVMLPIILLLLFGGLALFIWSIAAHERLGGHPDWPWFFTGLGGMILGFFLLPGFFTLQPNEAGSSSCSANTKARSARAASTGGILFT